MVETFFAAIRAPKKSVRILRNVLLCYFPLCEGRCVTTGIPSFDTITHNGETVPNKLCFSPTVQLLNPMLSLYVLLLCPCCGVHMDAMGPGAEENTISPSVPFTGDVEASRLIQNRRLP